MNSLNDEGISAFYEESKNLGEIKNPFDYIEDDRIYFQEENEHSSSIFSPIHNNSSKLSFIENSELKITNDSLGSRVSSGSHLSSEEHISEENLSRRSLDCKMKRMKKTKLKESKGIKKQKVNVDPIKETEKINIIKERNRQSAERSRIKKRQELEEYKSNNEILKLELNKANSMILEIKKEQNIISEAISQLSKAAKDELNKCIEKLRSSIDLEKNSNDSSYLPQINSSPRLTNSLIFSSSLFVGLICIICCFMVFMPPTSNINHEIQSPPRMLSLAPKNELTQQNLSNNFLTLSKQRFCMNLENHYSSSQNTLGNIQDASENKGIVEPHIISYYDFHKTCSEKNIDVIITDSARIYANENNIR